MATLFIVATPIGNLDDITIRAQKTLASVNHIFAEDTRVSRRLLQHIGVSTRSLPYHDFNKEHVTQQIMDLLLHGDDVAIISDAGTPGIADPAFNAVRAAVAKKINVVPVPGPCALIAALVASGLPTDRFIFEYFPPTKSARRKRFFRMMAGERRTVVFYESPHRIQKVLLDMQEVLGNVPVVIGREITKLHEEFLRGTPGELHEGFIKKQPRGEMVVMLNARDAAIAANENGTMDIKEDAEDPEDDR